MKHILFIICVVSFVIAEPSIFNYPIDFQNAMDLMQCISSMQSHGYWIVFGCFSSQHLIILEWPLMGFRRRISSLQSGFGKRFAMNDHHDLVVLGHSSITYIPFIEDQDDWDDTLDCSFTLSMISSDSQVALYQNQIILSNPATDQVNIGIITIENRKCQLEQWTTYIKAPSQSRSFGTSLAILKNFLYIGAPLDADDACSNNRGGNVHVYDLDAKEFYRHIQPHNAKDFVLNCNMNPRFGTTLASIPISGGGGISNGVLIGMQDQSLNGWMFQDNMVDTLPIIEQAYAGRQMSAFEVFTSDTTSIVTACTLGSREIYCYDLDYRKQMFIPFEDAIRYDTIAVGKYGLILGGPNQVLGNASRHFTPAPTRAPTPYPTAAPTTAAPTPPTQAPTPVPTTPAPTTPTPTSSPTEAPPPKTYEWLAFVTLGVLLFISAITAFYWYERKVNERKVDKEKEKIKEKKNLL